MKKTLVVLAASALLLGFNSVSAAPLCPSMGGFGGRGQGCGVTLMEERLGLNEKQCEKMDELQSNHFRKVSSERRKLAAMERELQTESLRAKPDNKKIDPLSEQIGKQHTALARLRSTQMAEVAAILTPAQLDSMRTMTTGWPRPGGYGGMMLK
jgi:Spy/CpxP family protein refolding chaperone